MDRRAVAEFGLSGRGLMERAGLATFECAQEVAQGQGLLTVFCGKGNNGGDGFVVARLAHQRGIPVRCIVAGHPDELAPLAAEQYQLACKEGVPLATIGGAECASWLEQLTESDVIVDGLLGTGASGEIRGPIATAIHAINQSGVPVIAIDIPSGIQSDTGEELGESVWALRTVTMGLPKPGLFQGIGLEHAGYWTVADIGYPTALLSEPTTAKLVSPKCVGRILPERLRSSHKGENGSVLIVAGSEAMPGAAVLAARAALRAGAGLVTIASIPSVCRVVSANLPEALTLPLPERYGTISPDAARHLLDAQHRFHAALFGPGLTHREAILNLLADTWPEWTVPSVIDADALNAVSSGVTMPTAECVMTPHPGEMSRLLHSSAAEVQSDRFRSIAQAVSDFKKTVVLKGPYSIVGWPGEPVCVNQTGNPGMASGGMGDVLSGVIATLLAQEIPTGWAAMAGVYWHGLAGDLCAESTGHIGYLASEVADALPRARAKITSYCD